MTKEDLERMNLSAETGVSFVRSDMYSNIGAVERLTRIIQEDSKYVESLKEDIRSSKELLTEMGVPFYNGTNNN